MSAAMLSISHWALNRAIRVMTAESEMGRLGVGVACYLRLSRYNASAIGVMEWLAAHAGPKA